VIVHHIPRNGPLPESQFGVRAIQKLVKGWVEIERVPLKDGMHQRIF
jgi:hypothetical protein